MNCKKLQCGKLAAHLCKLGVLWAEECPPNAHTHIPQNTHSKDTFKGQPEAVSMNAENTSNYNALHIGLTLIGLRQQNFTRKRNAIMQWHKCKCT
jgi:hypothetical protein